MLTTLSVEVTLNGEKYMRKLILTMIFSLAAGIAKADVMLYWTVDPKVKGYDYAVIYGISRDKENNVDVYKALDAVTAGSAIDTNVSLGSGSMYENYIVRLFDANYDYLSSCYTYADLAANVWATDMLSMSFAHTYAARLSYEYGAET